MAAPADYPFHAGEQEMQFKNGVWQDVESLGRRMIKPAVGPVHADVLSKLPMLLVTAHDGSGRLWASALVGSPGFLSVAAADPSLLNISSARLLGDGMVSLHQGQLIGCLGIQVATRRRVRVNGAIEAVERDAAGRLTLRVQVQQSYANCPKYIQKRTLQLDDSRPAGGSASMERGTGALGPAQQAVVAGADTFFIASSSGPAPSSDDSSGSSAAGQGSLAAVAAAFGHDLSHRGGPPGFVQVEEQGRVLRWGDYEGNFMFNTLGNLLVNPACALLFLDFSSGDVLMAAGDAEVLHRDRDLPGAHRAVRFTVQQWTHLRGELPLRQLGGAEPSPFNPAVPAAQPAAGSSPEEERVQQGATDSSPGNPAPPAGQSQCAVQ